MRHQMRNKHLELYPGVTGGLCVGQAVVSPIERLMLISEFKCVHAKGFWRFSNSDTHTYTHQAHSSFLPSHELHTNHQTHFPPRSTKKTAQLCCEVRAAPAAEEHRSFVAAQLSQPGIPTADSETTEADIVIYYV